MFDNSLFKPKDTVAVALSGGLDSVCLLHMLLDKKDDLLISVKAVNVEHGIRGENSKRDSLFVKNLCQKLGVPLLSFSVNVPEYAEKNGLSIETAARVLRYQCFDNALIGGFCNKIATAHHLSDDAETVLFNLFRGTGVSGVTGIKKSAYSDKIVRPLLSSGRSELYDYAKKNRLEFVTDETNADDAPTRNFLRLKVIPLIKERFPDFEKAVARFSEIAGEENAYLDEKARALIDFPAKALFIPQKSDLVLFKRAAIILLKELGFKKDYEKQHIDALAKLAALQTGASLNLKNGLVAYKSYDKIIFDKPDGEVKPQNETAFKTGEIVFGKYLLKFEKTDVRQKGTLCFDLNKLPEGCVVRLKKPGDKIVAAGGMSKSLKKYLTDKKIEARLSADFPVIARGNEVFIVCPVDIGEKVKTDENTTEIIKITCLNKGDENNV